MCASVLAAIDRIVKAEAAGSGAPHPPEITQLDRYPLNVNDKQASDRVADAFRAYFPAERVVHTGPAPASEDFGCFGTEWSAPSVFWFVGGTAPEIYAKAQAGRAGQPSSGQPQSAVRACSASNPRDGCGNVGRCRTGLAVGVNH